MIGPRTTAEPSRPSVQLSARIDLEHNKRQNKKA